MLSSSPTDTLSRLDHLTKQMADPRAVRFLKAPIRSALPLILRNTGWSRQTVADTFWGGRMNVMLPEAVSSLIWRFGFFEADVCRYLIESIKPGDTFLDIGGHFGFFSLLGSALAGQDGRVVTLEPMPQTFAFLSQNLEQHAAYRNFSPVNAAASDTPGELTFKDMGLVLAAYNSAYGARIANTQPVLVQIKAVTVDDVVAEKGLERVDVVKIDAESSEMLVLRGMERTLEKHSPKIIMEVGDFDIEGAARSRDLLDWLLDRGYRAYELMDNRLVPHAARDHYVPGNLMFIRS